MKNQDAVEPVAKIQNNFHAYSINQIKIKKFNFIE